MQEHVHSKQGANLGSQQTLDAKITGGAVILAAIITGGLGIIGDIINKPVSPERPAVQLTRAPRSTSQAERQDITDEVKRAFSPFPTHSQEELAKERAAINAVHKYEEAEKEAMQHDVPSDPATAQREEAERLKLLKLPNK